MPKLPALFLAISLQLALLARPPIAFAPYLIDGTFGERQHRYGIKRAARQAEADRAEQALQERRIFALRRHYALLIPPRFQLFVLNIQRQFQKEIPYHILYNLVWVESGWQERIISKPNSNGSRDFGLGQLNENNLAYFRQVYFTGRGRFNALNGYHNLEVAMRHLEELYRILGDWELAVRAYNCGLWRVRNQATPETTRRYAKIITAAPHLTY